MLRDEPGVRLLVVRRQECFDQLFAQERDGGFAVTFQRRQAVSREDDFYSSASRVLLPLGFEGVQLFAQPLVLGGQLTVQLVAQRPMFTEVGD